MEEAIVLLSVIVIAYAVISRRTASWPLSGPMVFVATGLLLGQDGLAVVDLDVGGEEVVVLAEITLAILLFSDAARADPTVLSREYALPSRLLGIGLPLTVAMGAVVTSLLLTDLSFAEAALVAAILAPTDAALGQPVVSNPKVPERVRETLNVESGLNDGLAVPIVSALGVIVAEGETEGAGSIVRLIVEQIGIGTLTGVVVGLAGGWAVLRAGRAGWVQPGYAQLAMLAIGLGAWAGANELDGNGFIAAFVAGVVVAVLTKGKGEEHVVVAEDVGQLLALLAFVAFGALFVGPALGELSLPVVVCGLATLTVGRMLPVAVALTGTGLRAPTVAFIGWFGPRGLASLLFGLLLITETEVEAGDDLFTVVTLVVLASVFLHGMTAAPLARRYADWYERTGDADMMEAGDAMRPVRPRWYRATHRKADGPQATPPS